MSGRQPSIMKNLVIIPLVALLLSVSHAAYSQMQFKHQSHSITCEQCHGTASPATKAKAKVCFNCHNYQDLAKMTSTKNLVLNPHDSHAGELRCTLCHKEHGQSVVYCKECHKKDDPRFDFKTP